LTEFKKILVVGAGTMGHGIAQAFAMGGYQVSLQDQSPQALERADILIKSSLDTMLEAGSIRKEDGPLIYRRIHFFPDLREAAREADLAIECIFENEEAKKAIFKQLDSICPAKTLLASNSTFLNIFDFVETSRPEKVLMAHWYAPAQIIPLVDVVKGAQTAERHIQEVADLLRKIGKKPVIFNKPLAGYIVSRLQVAFQREVYWLLDNDYVAAKELDEAAVWGLAMRMMVVGICQRIDFGGLDISAKSLLQATAQSTPVDYQPRKLLELVKNGELGVKSGKGFYDYKGKDEAEICRERDLRLLKLLKILSETDIAGPLPY
jgi:3-hydroxybutyryl-CoA dehydrogenase